MSKINFAKKNDDGTICQFENENGEYEFDFEVYNIVEYVAIVHSTAFSDFKIVVTREQAKKLIKLIDNALRRAA